MSKDPIPEIKQKILESRKIAVASHLRPDGDSICTSLALYFMGRMLDKEMSIFIRDRIPFPFNHYPDIDRIRIGQIPPTGFDCVILLECANVGRSGQDHLGEYYKINIDHHHSNDFYGDLNWVEPEAPAVACLAFKLGEALNIEFTPKIATQLYSGVVSDTGSFQFSNTTARAFDISRRIIIIGKRKPQK